MTTILVVCPITTVTSVGGSGAGKEDIQCSSRWQRNVYHTGHKLLELYGYSERNIEDIHQILYESLHAVGMEGTDFK